MRWAFALVGPENDGDFGDAGSNLAGLNDKLKGKFHPRAAQIQFVIKIAPKSPHSAVAVSDSRTEETIYKPTQTGIAEVPVERRHCAWLDAALEPIPHYEVVALAQFVNKIRNLTEIVTVVGIPHDDVLTASECYPLF